MRKIVLSVLLGAGFYSAAQADNTWDGGGANANWGNATNWGVNTPPTWSSMLNFAGTANLNPTNDQLGLTVGGFTFAVGAGAFTIRGNAITLGGDISNSSANVQTINLDMNLPVVRTIGLGNITLGGALSGLGGLMKLNATGAATLTLTGSNTYTGVTTIQKGTVVAASFNSVVGGTSFSSLGAPNTVSNGTIAMGAGVQASTLRYTGVGETSDRVIDLAGASTQSIDHQGTGYLKLTGGVTAISGTGTKTLRLMGATGTTGEVAGVIAAYSDTTHKTSVQFSGTGVWILSGTNTFVGDVILNAGSNPGWLQVSSDANLGSGTNISLAQNAALRTTASFGTSKTITLSAGGLNQDVYAGAGTILTLSNKVTGGAGGSLRIPGPGTVVYVAANDQSATTTVMGNLKLSAAGTINNGSATVTMNSGNIDLGGTAQTIGLLNIIGGNSYLTNGNLTVSSVTNGSFSTGVTLIGANLHGTGAYIAQNVGTLNLAGTNNTYGGGTVISGGTLIAGADYALGTSNITVASGATLTLQNGVLNNYINDTATLVLTNGAILNLSFSGKDIIAGISLNGGSTWLPKGTYNAAALNTGGVTCTGSGSLKVGKDVLRLISITSP